MTPTPRRTSCACGPIPLRSSRAGDPYAPAATTTVSAASRPLSETTPSARPPGNLDAIDECLRDDRQVRPRPCLVEIREPSVPPNCSQGVDGRRSDADGGVEVIEIRESRQSDARAGLEQRTMERRQVVRAIRPRPLLRLQPDADTAPTRRTSSRRPTRRHDRVRTVQWSSATSRLWLIPSAVRATPMSDTVMAASPFASSPGASASSRGRSASSVILASSSRTIASRRCRSFSFSLAWCSRASASQSGAGGLNTRCGFGGGPSSIGRVNVKPRPERIRSSSPSRASSSASAAFGIRLMPKVWLQTRTEDHAAGRIGGVLSACGGQRPGSPLINAGITSWPYG